MSRGASQGGRGKESEPGWGGQSNGVSQWEWVKGASQGSKPSGQEGEIRGKSQFKLGFMVPTTSVGQGQGGMRGARQGARGVGQGVREARQGAMGAKHMLY